MNRDWFEWGTEAKILKTVLEMFMILVIKVDFKEGIMKVFHFCLLVY